MGFAELLVSHYHSAERTAFDQVAECLRLILPTCTFVRRSA